MKYCSLLFAIITLTGCGTPSRDVYSYRDAGLATVVEFGTILDSRPVTIQGENTGLGGTAGGVIGGLAGSSIDGGGAIGTAVGAVAGIVIGNMAEQSGQQKHGTEYTIATEHGKVITVAQYDTPAEPRLLRGQAVMVQTKGDYQRVLSADYLPPTVARPHGVRVLP